MRRRKSISHYWGSAHRERSPEEKAQAEKETLEHVASILREECGRKDKTIGALELMVKSLAEELRLSRAERDEATRRLDEVTLGTGGAAGAFFSAASISSVFIRFADAAAGRFFSPNIRRAPHSSKKLSSASRTAEKTP